MQFFRRFTLPPSLALNSSSSALLLSVLAFAVFAFASMPGETRAQGMGQSQPESSSGSDARECPPLQEVSIPDSVSLYDEDLQIGAEDAPVKVAEFFDPNCPYCKSFHNKLLPAVFDRVPSDSTVIYMRPFPLGKESIAQFHALYHAESEGRFGSLINMMFSFGKPQSMGRDVLSLYANGVNIDSGPLVRAVMSGEYKDDIRRSIETARALGVDGTPTLFVGDRKVSREGYNPTCISQYIRSEMKQAGDTGSAGKSSASKARPESPPGSTQ